MTENSAIEWTDHTFNPWTGCTKISPGCDRCYAESWAKRSGHVEWGGQRRRTTVEYWQKPFKWNDKAKAAGRRARVFCASLADVFDNTVIPEWRADLWQLIRSTPDLDWLLLSKRIGNARAMLPDDWGRGYPNVWLGATVVNQEEADRDVCKLIKTPARVRFLSCEPLLGPIDLNSVPPEPGTTYFPGFTANDLRGAFARWQNLPTRAKLRDGVDWVIVGGESGGNARPLSVSWVQRISDDCAAAGAYVFVKQLGRRPTHYFPLADRKGANMEEWPRTLCVREVPIPAVSW